MNIVLVDTEEDLPQIFLLQVQQFINLVLNQQARDNWEVSVLFCTEAYIQQLNKNYREKHEPTDVLSFPQIDEVSEIPLTGPFIAGDIVVSLDYIRKNAAYFEVPVEQELKRVLIHGLLHLSGWDHETNETTEPMLVLQEKILNELQKDCEIRV